MTQRPSSGSARTPHAGTPSHGTRRRLRFGSVLGAAAAITVLVGLDVAASSPPQSSEGQPVAGAAVSDRQVLLGEALPVVPGGGVPAADKGSGQDTQSGASRPTLDPALAEQKPAAPIAELPAAPIAELRRASAAFEAAAGKVSAPVGPPGLVAPEPVMPDFVGVARGSALGELQARFHEFQHNGWVVSGSVKPTGSEKAEVILLERIPTHRFSSCMDSSGVEIRDTSGAVVLAAAPPGTRTATNIYDIQQHKGKWLVVAHSFPNVAAC